MYTRNINFLTIIRNSVRPGVIVLLLSVLATACRKEVKKERVTSYYGKSYTEVFEAFWNGMSSNYVFWDIETVDWDNMYKTYKPRFEYLDKQKNDPMAAQKAAQYIVDMTKDLADSHLDIGFNGQTTYLIANYEVTGFNFMPASIRHQLRGDRAPIPGSVFHEIIPKYYLTNARSGYDGGSFRINTGVIPRNNKEFLYLRFSSFQLSSQYRNPNSGSTPVKPVLEEFFRQTKDPSIDGLILDLRGNPGGSVADLDFLIGRLITSQGYFSNTRIKNGTGRLDYTPWVKGYVHPQPGGTNFTKPIVVLVDQYSVSMSEMTALAVKFIFPNSKLVGEKTWGGTGQIPFNDTRYLGGQFIAAGFVKVYTTGVEFRDKNLVSYENKGIVPDIQIPYDPEAIKSNIDVQLEKGIEYLISR